MFSGACGLCVVCLVLVLVLVRVGQRHDLVEIRRLETRQFLCRHHGDISSRKMKVICEMSVAPRGCRRLIQVPRPDERM